MPSAQCPVGRGRGCPSHRSPVLGTPAGARALVLTPPASRGTQLPPTLPKEPSQGTSTCLFAFQTTAAPAVARHIRSLEIPSLLPPNLGCSSGLLLLGWSSVPTAPPPQHPPVLQSLQYLQPLHAQSHSPGQTPPPSLSTLRLPHTDQWCRMVGCHRTPSTHKPPHELGPAAPQQPLPPVKPLDLVPPKALRHHLSLPAPLQTTTSRAGIKEPLGNVSTSVREKKKVKSAWSCPAPQPGAGAEPLQLPRKEQGPMPGVPQTSQLAQDQRGHAAPEQSQPRPAIPCRGALASQSPPKSGQGRGAPARHRGSVLKPAACLHLLVVQVHLAVRHPVPLGRLPPQRGVTAGCGQ